VEEISKLDSELRTKLHLIPHEQVATWRQVFRPPQDAWWWWEDKNSIERAQRKDLPWEIIAGTFLLLSTPLVLDVIKRLWDGAPDTISIFGTLLTLLITASPLVKQGRLAFQWVLKSVPWLKEQDHAKAMAWLSFVIFLLLVGTDQWLLPYPLATFYNNTGVEAQAAGNLARAQDSFRRAAALNPDRVVPYYNIARGYEQTGLLKKAEEWSQKAIEEDASFGPAYRGLGQIYNEQAEFAAAEEVLIAGLATTMSGVDEVTAEVTRYELLANLGWSYFAQGKTELAEKTLTSALEMEDELKGMGEQRRSEYRLALPHFYLAQIFEQTNDLPNAIIQWQESLRFLDEADWRQHERYLIAQEHLQRLKEK
jgi:tetratricopeptide (TPR) repeat protein